MDEGQCYYNIVGQKMDELKVTNDYEKWLCIECLAKMQLYRIDGAKFAGEIGLETDEIHQSLIPVLEFIGELETVIKEYEDAKS